MVHFYILALKDIEELYLRLVRRQWDPGPEAQALGLLWVSGFLVHVHNIYDIMRPKCIFLTWNRAGKMWQRCQRFGGGSNSFFDAREVP